MADPNRVNVGDVRALLNADLRTFQPDGINRPEWKSLGRDARLYAFLKPDEQAQVAGWLSTAYPKLSESILPLLKNPDLAYDKFAGRRTVTINREAVSEPAKEFIAVLESIDGPAIDLTSRNTTPLSADQIRAIYQAVGPVAFDRFVANVILGPSNIEFATAVEGYEALGQFCVEGRVSPQSVKKLRASARSGGSDFLAKFDAGYQQGLDAQKFRKDKLAVQLVRGKEIGPQIVDDVNKAKTRTVSETDAGPLGAYLVDQAKQNPTATAAWVRKALGTETQPGELDVDGLNGWAEAFNPVIEELAFGRVGGFTMDDKIPLKRSGR